MHGCLELLVSRPCRILILGVHGAAMRAIAQFCLDQGHTVFGFDDAPKSYLIDERIQWLEPTLTQTPFDFVIYSTAISKTYPKLIAAEKLGAFPLPRTEFITFISQYYKTIAITGTHGKTTCCALLQYAMDTLGIKHDFLIGGYVRNSQRQGRSRTLTASRSEYLIIELDESLPFDKNIHLEILCILNVKADHLENFNFKKSLYIENFNAIVKAAKHVVVGCKEASRVLNFVSSPILSQTRSNNLDLERTSLPLCSSNQGVYASIEVIEQLIATIFGRELDRLRILQGFQGVGYRFEQLGSLGQIACYRDYGHLPHEIDNFYQALKSNYHHYKKIIVFQPHKYSRLAEHFDGFCQALMNYDEIIVLPVYQAGEQAHLYQCDHYSLVEALRKKHKLCYVKDNLKNLDLSAYIKTQKSVLVFQGAGDIKEMAQSYVQYSSSLIECGIE